MDNLLKLLKKINMDSIEDFDGELESIKRLQGGYCFNIKLNKPIHVDIYNELINKLRDTFKEFKTIDLKLVCDNNFVSEYYLYFIDKYSKKDSLLKMFMVCKIDYNNNVLNVEVDSDTKSKSFELVKDRLLKDFNSVGINATSINVFVNEDEKIKKAQEELRRIQIEAAKTQEKIEQMQNAEEKKEFKFTPRKKFVQSDDPNVLLGEKINNEEVVTLDSIQDEIKDTCVEVMLMAVEGKEIFSKAKNKDFRIITFKVTDFTNSMSGTMFANSKEELDRLIGVLKPNAFYKMKGDVRTDARSGELSFSPRSIYKIDKKLEARKDTANEKRIELHAHTKMSQMDGVADEIKLVHQAMDFGHMGIGITDHDCCQAFPHVFTEVTSFNKGLKKKAQAKIDEIKSKIEEATTNNQDTKELEQELTKAEEDKKNLKFFKAAYGSELNMCESFLNVCFNADDREIKNNTFVVFDTETTGFNPGLSDSMIEIGGVKIKNGEVIDRFDELINPGHHIDDAITKVTDISDDDVKDADNEENVVIRFKEWIEDFPLVAHNARFDKNMLDMAYYKYNLGTLSNPIIDTLMLSRVINRDLKKHSLKALGKFYGIDTGEVEEEEDNDDVTNDTLIESKLNIKDILVDDVSVIKNVDNKKYLVTVHKASKTEFVNIKVIKNDDSVIEDSYKLHPADNNIEIDITSMDKINILVYVGQHHGADVDSENTGYIFNKMMKQIEGITRLNELNDLGKLEDIAIKNDPKLLKKVSEIVSYKNYVRPIGEDEEVDPKFGNPFTKYGVEGYVWKYEWCHEDHLQMYENIPSKTFKEHLANVYDNNKHVTFLATNKVGLKNLFKIVSFANSNFLQSIATIPRKIIDDYREGVLVGSACLNGEIFYLAETRSDEDLIKAMEFYDYIEVQPPENYYHLLKGHDIDNIDDLYNCLEKIIRCAHKAGKIVIATGDVHSINKEDRIYREIIVNQNVPGKGRHPLARYLNGSVKPNKNVDLLKEFVNDYGNDFNELDIKILKYIYTLTDIKSIPITLNNLALIYQIGDKEQTRNTDIDKKEVIESAIRKFEVAGIIKEHLVNEELHYNMVTDNNKYYVSEEIYEDGHIPHQYFRTTNEMLDAFSFLKDESLIKEIVIDNPQKILDKVEEIEVVVYPDKPFSPIIEHSQETCRDLVFDKAHSMYGDPLPRMIEERIAQEFYGDKILGLVDEKIKLDNPEYDENKINEVFASVLHGVIMSGYDGVVNLMKERLVRENPELEESKAIEDAKSALGGIIGGGFDVIYLIAQKLVKHSNDDGYLVGSRGSVGSSFVASMMGITECNGLPPHYYCPECQFSMFEDENGEKYTVNYSSGFDLPERDCPKCGAHMIHQGNDMPFATFLGFNADKVPDIDLNFSGDNQASAHEYTKVLFGTDNVYRAGTISTVADKTAFGYVLGFYEEQLYNKLRFIAKSFGINVSGKDELKKKGVIKCTTRTAEVERISLGCMDVKRTTGQHPGGIVVVPGYRDVWDFTPFQYPADDPTAAWRTTHFDYHAIDADLLKLDILGHDDPTVLRMLQDMTGVDVTAIDLGDKDTMSIFTGPEILGVKKEDLRGLTTKEGKKYCPTGTLGVPEFGTSFLLGMLEETKPTTFAELIKISGLSHGTDVWLGNARDLCTPDENGEIKVPFKDVIGCRDDIMVTLIKWGMKPAKAFKIMEFVRKGKASKDPGTWQDHVKTMREANIPEWYIESCQKIKYMFPKAHATAYVTSAFRIAWFKVHMPLYYYAAYFSIRCAQFDVASMVGGYDAIKNKIDELEEKKSLGKSTNKEEEVCDVLYVCLEMTARGFYFHNVDVELSDASKFTLTSDSKGLVIPFSALDGMGGMAAKKIVEERKKKPFLSIKDLRERGKCPEKIVNDLMAFGALKDLPESNQLSIFNFGDL